MPNPNVEEKVAERHQRCEDVLFVPEKCDSLDLLLKS